MRCKVIINACSSSYPGRAEEAAAFIAAHSSIIGTEHAESTEAVIFYSDEDTSEDLRNNTLFQHIKLIKIIHYQPGLVLKILEAIESRYPADIYIFSGDFSGNELAVRFARRLEGSSLAAVERVTVKQNQLIGIKKVYSGNLRGSFHFKKKPYCLSLARGMNRVEPNSPQDRKEITSLDYSAKRADHHIINYSETPKQEDQRLEKARLVFAVGRGCGSKDEIMRLENIAKTLHAELGVSRPVYMNAWAPLDRLLGASGTVASPDICIALAVSGSPPFYYGIEKSKIIIAINTDPDAPIVKAADLAVIEDYRKVIGLIIELVRKELPDGAQ